jgi:hypothetical protein
MAEVSRSRMNVGSILLEYGPNCSQTMEIFRKTLHGIGVKIDEEQLAGIIILVMRPIQSAGMRDGGMTI